MRRLALLGAVAALAAGCGGPKPTASAAELVPPGARSFVAVRTDLGPLPHVLDRFPFGPRALQALSHALKLRSSMGPELDVAFFESGSVGFTQPADEQAFVTALRPGEVHARIRGWTAFSDNAALLRLVQHHDGKLSELPAYRAAFGRLPAGALVRAYGARGALASRLGALGSSLPASGWTAGALTAHRDSLKLEVYAQSAGPAAPPLRPGLVSRIPDDAVVALGFGGGARIPAGLKVGGFDARAVARALGGDAVAYARPGLPFPEVTIASEPRDAAKALRDVERLIARLARPTRPTVTTTVDGVALRDVPLGAVDVYYGRLDGLLAVSNTQAAVAELRSSGHGLKVPGLPDTAESFLYVDVERALPAAETFALLANQRLPLQAVAAARPLKRVVVYGVREPGVQALVALLQLR